MNNVLYYISIKSSNVFVKMSFIIRSLPRLEHYWPQLRHDTGTKTLRGQRWPGKRIFELLHGRQYFTTRDSIAKEITSLFRKTIYIQDCDLYSGKI